MKIPNHLSHPLTQDLSVGVSPRLFGLPKHAACLIALAFVSGSASAQTPSILLEACTALEPASKRLECLRAANGTRPDPGTAYGSSATPRAAYATPQSASLAPAASATPRSSGGQTCYTGPRGGTYTITASGRKNYSGC